jgi:hypothetical protein
MFLITINEIFTVLLSDIATKMRFPKSNLVSSIQLIVEPTVVVVVVFEVSKDL